MTTKKKKPKPAKKAVVVWRRMEVGKKAFLGDRHIATVYSSSENLRDGWSVTADAEDLSLEAQAHGFRGERAAKAAALDLAEMVRKWGGKRP